MFGKYGTIVDLRIHSKPNNKGVQGNRVPNYGFIIFEDPNVVQQVLNSRVSVYGVNSVAWATELTPFIVTNTVIPRLTKIICSRITFVSRNVISRRFLYKIV